MCDFKDVKNFHRNKQEERNFRMRKRDGQAHRLEMESMLNDFMVDRDIRM